MRADGGKTTPPTRRSLQEECQRPSLGGRWVALSSTIQFAVLPQRISPGRAPASYSGNRRLQLVRAHCMRRRAVLILFASLAYLVLLVQRYSGPASGGAYLDSHRLKGGEVACRPLPCRCLPPSRFDHKNNLLKASLMEIFMTTETNYPKLCFLPGTRFHVFYTGSRTELGSLFSQYLRHFGEGYLGQFIFLEGHGSNC